ncbi:hypothetical protein M3221_13605 [Domibacillus indicus]|uniref:hypothetical protein n=1 Tax=Domibacillus indicus TaxID=1437523 RepID=UPI00203C726A|nr:hypothetical protein [Domibacillus indicus]MCM3789436.1 hypothetical protein [Domibacillus indicus]
MSKQWKCGNCGLEVEATEELKELSFRWMDKLTSKTTCQNCGSYTIQRAFDDRFQGGHFLIVKARMKR